MRGVLVGLVIGLVVGAGAMYLVLKPPWGGGQTARPPIDAGVAKAPVDAGTKGKKKRVRRPSGQPNAVPGPDEEFEDEIASLVQLTDAQRKMETRGDDVTLPARTMDMANDARPLEQGEIQNVLASQGKSVTGCVMSASDNTDLNATIEVDFVVDGNGRVTKSRLKAPRYLFDKGVLACTKGALGRMKFPATGAPTRVEFPVTRSIGR